MFCLLQSANKVIDTLGGMELEGKKLLAELAKEPTRESNPGRKNEGAKAADKKKKGGSNTDKANDKRGRKDKRKNSKDKTTMNEDDDDDEEPLSDPIAIARAEMEADAILQLERAKRAAAKRAAEADAIAKERLQREAALEVGLFLYSYGQLV